jgi:branched-chain amino acid transport system permease protein
VADGGKTSQDARRQLDADEGPPAEPGDRDAAARGTGSGSRAIVTPEPHRERITPPSSGRDAVARLGASARRIASARALWFAGAAAIVLFLMPSVLAPYPLVILSHMLVLAIACLALNLVFGTGGMLSLGHATYFGAAAYSGAFLYRFSWVESFELYLLCGVASSVVFAAVIGFLCVRTSRIFFSILTLAFSMVVHSLVIDGAVFMLFGGLGWSLYLLGEGSMYIPRLTILTTEIAPRDFIPAFYNVIVVAFLASALALWRIDRSPFGKALRAIRDNDVRAAFIGIPVWKVRWTAFVLSGFFMGLAGGLYGQLARQITPEQLHWLFSAQLVVATVLGGTRHFLGPVLGAFAFVALDEFTVRWLAGRNLLLGLLLIATILAFPRGIAGGFSALLHMLGRRR